LEVSLQRAGVVARPRHRHRRNDEFVLRYGEGVNSMDDLVYGRSLNVLVGALFLVVAYVYVRVLRRYKDNAIVRVAAAVVAIPTMGALVIFQINLFRIVTGVSTPLHSDTVFFATLVGEGLAGLALFLRAALKVRDATGGE